MGMPSARISDMHVCPMVTGVVPHVGGPIMPPEVGGYHGSDLFAAGCRGGQCHSVSLRIGFFDRPRSHLLVGL